MSKYHEFSFLNNHHFYYDSEEDNLHAYTKKGISIVRKTWWKVSNNLIQQSFYSVEYETLTGKHMSTMSSDELRFLADFIEDKEREGTILIICEDKTKAFDIALSIKKDDEYVNYYSRWINPKEAYIHFSLRGRSNPIAVCVDTLTKDILDTLKLANARLFRNSEEEGLIHVDSSVLEEEVHNQ